MGHHPVSVSWEARDDKEHLRQKKVGGLSRLTDEQCAFINENVGVSRQTLKDVAIMFNAAFNVAIPLETFVQLRADAIAEGRCRTTYFRNYFKGENSSERELRKQRAVLTSRLIGSCQYQTSSSDKACGAETSGRYCEAHVRAGHKSNSDARRGADYIDSSLGKYG